MYVACNVFRHKLLIWKILQVTTCIRLDCSVVFLTNSSHDTMQCVVCRWRNAFCHPLSLVIDFMCGALVMNQRTHVQCVC